MSQDTPTVDPLRFALSPWAFTGDEIALVRKRLEEAMRAALSATQPAQAAQSTHWTENEPVRLAPSRVGRVYVAGPMTGIADFNFPAFNAETETLRAQGLSVLNPADHGIVAGANWADYLRHDIAGLASCERIHLLRGWSKSKGAQLEVTIAKALGMVITYQDGAETAQAAQGEPVQGVPDGWEIREDDTWIYFKRPDGFCQAVTPNDPHTSHAQTLHMLMRAMLTASPTPPAQQPSFSGFVQVVGSTEQLQWPEQPTQQGEPT